MRLTGQRLASNIRLRSMQERDVAAVYAVQQACYVADMVEPQELILNRLQQAPETAWVAEDTDGIGAYLVAYRSVRHKISALGSDFAPVQAADTLYLHDMAVHPRWRGCGVAAQLLSCAVGTACATGLQWLALVSVQDTLQFWQKHGFQPQSPDAEQQKCLATYSGAAVYCLLTLSSAA